ncbi:MAG TPA: hypothetical protein VE153_33835 [Myxococcus sp.]|nr:hypothetical protein [Myxococcus sp.]
MGIPSVNLRSPSLFTPRQSLLTPPQRGGDFPEAGPSANTAAAAILFALDAFQGAPLAPTAPAVPMTPAAPMAPAAPMDPMAQAIPTQAEVRQRYPGLKFIPKGKTGAGLVNGLIPPEQVDWQQGINLGKVRGKPVMVSPANLEKAAAKLQDKIARGKVKPGKMPGVELKSVRVSDSKKVNFKLFADGTVGVQSENKPKGGLFKKILGAVAPVAAAFIPVVGPFISAGLSVYNGVKAVKNKDYLGAITSFAGGIGGGAAALGLKTVAKGAELVGRGAQAVQTGINAVKARDLPGFLQAGAGFLGTAAGAVGGRFQGWSDNLNQWSMRLEQGARVARIAQNPQALLGEALDVLTPRTPEYERRPGG